MIFLGVINVTFQEMFPVVLNLPKEPYNNLCSLNFEKYCKGRGLNFADGRCHKPLELLVKLNVTCRYFARSRYMSVHSFKIQNHLPLLRFFFFFNLNADFHSYCISLVYTNLTVSLLHDFNVL